MPRRRRLLWKRNQQANILSFNQVKMSTQKNAPKEISPTNFSGNADQGRGIATMILTARASSSVETTTADPRGDSGTQRMTAARASNWSVFVTVFEPGLGPGFGPGFLSVFVTVFGPGFVSEFEGLWNSVSEYDCCKTQVRLNDHSWLTGWSTGKLSLSSPRLAFF